MRFFEQTSGERFRSQARSLNTGKSIKSSLRRGASHARQIIQRRNQPVAALAVGLQHLGNRVLASSQRFDRRLL